MSVTQRWMAEAIRTLAVVAVAGGVLCAPARAALEPVVYTRQDGAYDLRTIFKTDEFGGLGSQVVGPRARDGRLSPDGHRIVYAIDGSLWTKSIRGGDVLSVLPRTTTCGASQPFWGADQNVIFFTRDCDDRTYADVWRVNIDGTALKRLIGWKHPQRLVDVSEDGRLILFESNAKPNGTIAPHSHYMASAIDGTGYREVTPPAGQPYAEGTQSARFSPDHSKIAFSGQIYLSGQDLFVANTAGTGVRRLTTTPTRDEYVLDWAPESEKLCVGVYDGNGGYLVMMDPNTGLEVSAPFAYGSYWYRPEACSFRQQSAYHSLHDHLAAEFQPILRFDRDEPWRPIDVDALLREKTAGGLSPHRICDPTQCLPTDGLASLASSATEMSYLDLNGFFNQHDNVDVYRSPDPACATAYTETGEPVPTRDCDTGTKSILYYRVSAPSPGGYKYLDYWWFYRYNHALDLDAAQDLNHEGDWEGVTIAPSKDVPSTFDFATFSQHGHWVSYLREALNCDNYGSGSCGTESSKGGKRVVVYPARGTHANYPQPCFSDPCAQGLSRVPERPGDGEAPWGRNYGDPTTTLRRFPTAAGWPSPGNFVDWPGRWGYRGLDGGAGPRSPALQEPHWSQPWSTQCATLSSGCAVASSRRTAVTLAERSALPRQRGRVAHAAAAEGRRDLAPKFCASWFASDVAAVACDPASLGKSVDTGRLAPDAAVTLALRGRRGRAASSRGIAQLLATPLRAGDVVDVRGRLTTRLVLFVRLASRGRTYEARFAAGQIKGGRRATISVRAGLRRPVVRLQQPGRAAVQPIELRALRIR